MIPAGAVTRSDAPPPAPAEVPIRSKGMRSLLTKLVASRSGATAIEYALIAGVLATALIISLPAIRAALAALFAQIEPGFQ